MDEARATTRLSVYTVGHSNHSVEQFLQLLRGQGIEVVIDTRSFPYSKYAPQFNVDVLRNVIKGSKLRFGYLGRELGGGRRMRRSTTRRGTRCITRWRSGRRSGRGSRG